MGQGHDGAMTPGETMALPEPGSPPGPLRTPLGEGNLTLRVDQGVLLWARVRALQNGSNVNREIRRFLEEYAAVPRWWLEGRPEPRDTLGE